MMIDFKEILLSEKNISTLKEMSCDNENNENMTDNETLKVYNFDKVKEEYVKIILKKLPGDTLSSVDAMFKNNDNIFFVEFKNGANLNKSGSKNNISNKLRDSILICSDLFNENTSYFRENAIFILVYNEDKNSHFQNLIENNIMQRAKEEKIRFGLDKFNKLYLKEIHTYTKKQFESFLLRAEQSI